MLKVCVFTICKNEKELIPRWLASANEADYICVNDTGSTDGSDALWASNPKVRLVHSKSQFRFDRAWNEVLDIIPPDADILVRLDMDQAFTSGWRSMIERKYSSLDEDLKRDFCICFNIPMVNELLIGDARIPFKVSSPAFVYSNVGKLRCVGAVHEEFLNFEKQFRRFDLERNEVVVVHTPKTDERSKADFYGSLSVENFTDTHTYQNFLIAIMGVYNEDLKTSIEKKNLTADILLQEMESLSEEEEKQLVLKIKGPYGYSATRYAPSFYIFAYFFNFYYRKNKEAYNYYRKKIETYDHPEAFEKLPTYGERALYHFFNTNQIKKEDLEKNGQLSLLPSLTMDGRLAKERPDLQ